MRALAVLFAATSLAACATTGGAGAGTPADVIRYHLGEPLPRGTVMVQPAAGGDGLAYQPFADAVSRSLGGAGYAAPVPGGDVQFIAEVSVARVSRAEHRPPPFSIGLGGATFGGGRNSGFGLGGGVDVPVGRGRTVIFDSTELSVLIKRRADQSPVWEGHARTVDRQTADKQVLADKLARALFTGFPGESGRTITVR
ncbi:DUF4136 domain-containing protein [Sphingomonas sp.]|uniref:DUF4136 domain-containing protein n=1 Tax=Sphingomonas sp. TaxID=28214 RepID=UPI003CC5906E